MRKGKGELTYHQLKVINEELKRQIRNLEAERDKIQVDYNSLKIAHNKLLKERAASEKGTATPYQKVEMSTAYGRTGRLPDGVDVPMGFIGFNGGGGR